MINEVILSDGTVFRSPTTILPNGMPEMIAYAHKKTYEKTQPDCWRFMQKQIIGIII